MLNKLAATAALAILPLTLCAAPEIYKIDTVHSHIIFKIKHMNVSYSYGEFNDFAGTATLDAEAPEKSSIQLDIKADSIDTKNKKRDEHLHGPDFFNVKEHPTITFKSTSVKAIDDKNSEVTGDMTMMGVTKPITMKIEKIGEAKGMKGETRAGAEATFTIKRSDFGMGQMQKALGDEVEVTAALEAIKQ